MECRDLLFLYKGVNGLLNFPLSNFIRFSTGRTRSAASSLNLRHFLRFGTSLFSDSYFIRIVYLWNDLPLSIRQTPSIKLFKIRLYEHYFKRLDCDFETDRIRTWKTICPASVQARWREHFYNLLNREAEVDQTVINELRQFPVKHELADLPTPHEVSLAIMSLKSIYFLEA